VIKCQHIIFELLCAKQAKIANHMLNVYYKIITKVLTNRLARCITSVISDLQYGFIKGRYIMDGVLSLHEIIHEVKRKKQNGVIFKVDFEKA
jgi:hypothetical protein